jgi:iron(III) transport system permease protein
MSRSAGYAASEHARRASQPLTRLSTQLGHLLAHLDWSKVVLLGAVALLVYLVAVPVAIMVWGSFRDGRPGLAGAYTLANYGRAFSDPLFAGTLANTAIFTLGATAIAMALGAILAWLTQRTDMPLKGLVYTAMAMLIIAPGILTSIAWVMLLSPEAGLLNGALRLLLGPEAPRIHPFNLGGMIFVQGLELVPLPFLLLGAALRAMDPLLEQAAAASGASSAATVRRITAPLMRPAVLATFLLLSIRTLETFEVPALLGVPGRVPVLATEIWLQVSGIPPDFNMAATFGVAYLALSGAGVLLYLRATRLTERFATIGGRAHRARPVSLGVWRYPACGLALTVVLLAAGLPILAMLWMSVIPYYSLPSAEMLERLTLDNYVRVLQTPRIGAAAANNVFVGAAASTVAVGLGALIAWIVLRTRLPGRGLLDVLAFAPFALPGTALGLALVWLYLTLPLGIYGTLWIVVIAFATATLPLAVRVGHFSLGQIRLELEEAAAVSGATTLAILRRITLPLALAGLLAAWLYIFALTFKILSVPAMLTHTGNRTLPVVLLTMYRDETVGAVSALAVMLMFLVGGLTVVAMLLSRRLGVRGTELL